MSLEGKEELVLRLATEGKSSRYIAKQVGTSHTTVQSWLRSVGVRLPKPQRKFTCDTKGYGILRFGGRSRRAHRVSYFLANSRDIVGELVIHHRCDNPLAVTQTA